MYQNKQLTLGFFELNRDAQHTNSITSRLGLGKFPQLQIKLKKKINVHYLSAIHQKDLVQSFIPCCKI